MFLNGVIEGEKTDILVSKAKADLMEQGPQSWPRRSSGRVGPIYLVKTCSRIRLRPQHFIFKILFISTI